jgi:hypothetical protein
VHNEEIAFRFYTHVAAESESKMVRKYAEILAREELGHAALLRAERRRAYHLEREDDMVEPRLDPKSIHNKADLLVAAIHIDHFLEEEMNKISENSPEITSLSRETRLQITSNEDILSDLAMNKKEVPGESFSFYDAVVDVTNDEAVMLTAQKLSSLALDRIGVLKETLGKECGCTD